MSDEVLAGWCLMVNRLERYWRHTTGWEVQAVRGVGRRTAWVGVSPSGAVLRSGGEARGEPWRTAALAMAGVDLYRSRTRR